MDGLRIHANNRDDLLKDRLHDEINRFNQEATGFRDGRGLNLRVDDEAGQLVAGLTGWTWGGTGYVDVLWVRADFRGSGWGGRLLDAAEQEASARGCTSVVLSTHSFQAPSFYRARGYVDCGRFPEYPVGHYEVHFTMSLTRTWA
jgi:ribosomal protein S18 acetylase RimI-like enzyme